MAAAEPTRVDSATGMEVECQHERTLPPFDEELVKGISMPAHEVRRRFPRFEGNCPDCGQQMVTYASFAHYVWGDW